MQGFQNWTVMMVIQLCVSLNSPNCVLQLLNFIVCVGASGVAIPPSGCLKTTAIYGLTFLEAWSPKWSCHRTMFPLDPIDGHPPIPLPASGISWHPCHSWLRDRSLQSVFHCHTITFSWVSLSLIKRINPIGLAAHPTPVCPHLN